MKVHLKCVTRENWEKALALKVKKQQSNFVPPVAVSLAKVYIKPDGDNIVYLPFAIYDKEIMVGFIMHAYDENTTNMYWINGFIIDESYQGKGYGRAALSEMVHWIANRFTICKEIRLTVFKDNENARELYKRFGFLPTGDVYGEEDVWFLPIK
ncbi:GNAT family N-acetyltransferase [Peribacillus sp. RS7]|uniref:GNAT family N-acetyltransferase n=1 Tax=Peribacillus TaxID=2675229 RepID=UPI0025A20BD4|nr:MULTISPECIES: GNAT family N-acetyltransferase [unclassified Peribacillus]MDM5219687.1 GNAT family N-acetyltransferase [Peribacillus sp. NJ11]MDM5357043.1 GNAT family N-acetyltransferase [Peribacillus sp. ACCC06369]